MTGGGAAPVSISVVVPVKDGRISLYNGSPGDADFVVDVLGYQSW